MFPGDRPQGVRVPDQQLRSGVTGQPNTVGQIIAMQPYAVQYYDENGQEHRTIVYKMGNSVYFDVNAERWAAGLRQASGFIAQAVNAEHAVLMSPPGPSSDAVDVLAKEEVSGQASTTPK
jgi:hypothetical protein